MSSVYVGRNLRKFESAPQFSGITRVVLQVSDELEYSAGTDTGRTLTAANPWGNQARAEVILAQVKGYAYQPYRATGAIVDAAAELGDAVSVNGVYSGVYALTRRYGGIQFADLNAPSDEEIDHEYPYKSQQERKITRQFRDVRASLKVQADRISAEVEDRTSAVNTLYGALTVQADRITQEVSERQGAVQSLNSALILQSNQIEAKVSKTGGDNESFAYSILSDHCSMAANGNEVFRVDKNGASINGIIRATGGKIGGFDITQDSLSYNNQVWGGTNTTGIYIGISGIQLGKNFRVDSAGNLKAASGEFDGYVKAGNIQYGDGNGYLSGSGLASHSVYGSQIGYNTISTAYTSGGINTSLGYADYANGVFNGWNTATWFKGTYVNCRYLTVNDEAVAPMKITFATPSGGSRSIWVLGRSIS